MKKKLKFASIGVGVAIVAATMVGLGSAPAFAAGYCSSIGRDYQNIVGTCYGSVKVSWTCTSDIFNTLNTRTLNHGSMGLSFTFKACNQGVPTGIGVTSI